MKNQRQNLIMQIVKDESIGTQEELREALKRHGLKVTQATVSRDIKELSLVKTIGSDGNYKYSLLALDATTGQNAVNQARQFNEVADITGIILTKLDGTAKGGIIISITDDLQVPVKLVTVGEKIDDIQPFSARDFVEALFE